MKPRALPPPLWRGDAQCFYVSIKPDGSSHARLHAAVTGAERGLLSTNQSSSGFNPLKTSQSASELLLHQDCMIFGLDSDIWDRKYLIRIRVNITLSSVVFTWELRRKGKTYVQRGNQFGSHTFKR